MPAMTHVCGNGQGEGEDWDPNCANWHDGDRVVCVHSAVDPNILLVDCPDCAAAISKELREG